MSAVDREETWSDFRVGLMTTAAIAMIIAGVTLAGGAKGLFLTKTSTIKAWLPDVGGLKNGAAVTMGGMTVGEVKKIAFASERRDLIEVTMRIRADVQERLRQDSVAKVRTQGMLGDRYVEISIGGAEAEPFLEPIALTGDGSSNFDEALEEARLMLIRLRELIEDFKSHPKKYVKLSIF